MQTADKRGTEKDFQGDFQTGQELTRHLGCPCRSTTAMHLGGCFFAATMVGAAVKGTWGAVIGACLGLIIGAFAAFKDR